LFWRAAQLQFRDGDPRPPSFRGQLWNEPAPSKLISARTKVALKGFNHGLRRLSTENRVSHYLLQAVHDLPLARGNCKERLENEQVANNNQNDLPSENVLVR
jgi:hypothetical protein